MPRSTKPGWVEWKQCPGRQVILDDLKDEIIPLKNSYPVKWIWDAYKEREEFRGVCFEQFAERFEDHKKQEFNFRKRAETDMVDLLHDLSLHPPRTTNRQGEPLFYLSDAKEKLEEDVKEKKHEKMTPSKLRRSRPEYMAFRMTDDEFKQRIYQEVKRQKFIHYLNWKRDMAKQEQEERWKNKNKRKEIAEEKKKEAEEKKKRMKTKCTKKG